MDLQTFTNNKIKYLIVRDFNKKYFSLAEYFFPGHSRTNSKKLKNSKTFQDKTEIPGLSRTVGTMFTILTLLDNKVSINSSLKAIYAIGQKKASAGKEFQSLALQEKKLLT